MIRHASVVMALLLATGLSPAEEGLDLGVVVAGVIPQQGQVVVSLFNEKKAWLKNPVLARKKDAGEGDSVEVHFPGLAAGDYALSVFYDQDGNGEMATGMFGIPKEPVGFSNDARRKFGPAKWKQTRFELTEDTTVTVNLVRILD